MDYNLEIFNPHKATDQTWDIYFNHTESIFLEGLPEDTPHPRELEKNFMININPYYDIYRWIIISKQEPKKIIGMGLLYFENEKAPNFESVKKVATLNLSIDKAYRRKGWATRMFKTLVQKALDLEKTTLRLQTYCKNGFAFAESLGGKIVANRGINRLYLKNVNWNLMDYWRKKVQGRVSGVTLETFQTVPDKDLEEFCKLYTEVMNQAPAEDLPGGFIVSPERRRIDEKDMIDKKYNWITMITREPSGKISGMTEIYYHPDMGKEIEQELTGVSEAFRGRGLGKWLKAEMLYYITKHFPEVEYITTENNIVNKSMVSINTRMGYQLYKAQKIFKFNIVEVAEKLGLN